MLVGGTYSELSNNTRFSVPVTLIIVNFGYELIMHGVSILDSPLDKAQCLIDMYRLVESYLFSHRTGIDPTYS